MDPVFWVIVFLPPQPTCAWWTVGERRMEWLLSQSLSARRAVPGTLGTLAPRTVPGYTRAGLGSPAETHSLSVACWWLDIPGEYRRPPHPHARGCHCRTCRGCLCCPSRRYGPGWSGWTSRDPPPRLSLSKQVIVTAALPIMGEQTLVSIFCISPFSRISSEWTGCKGPVKPRGIGNICLLGRMLWTQHAAGSKRGYCVLLEGWQGRATVTQGFDKAAMRG